jgi:hypothetical protein
MEIKSWQIVRSWPPVVSSCVIVSLIRAVMGTCAVVENTALGTCDIDAGRVRGTRSLESGRAAMHLQTLSRAITSTCSSLTAPCADMCQALNHVEAPITSGQPWYIQVTDAPMPLSIALYRS